MARSSSILFFLPDLDGGGAQRTVVNLAGDLAGMGFETALAVARWDGPARAWLDPGVTLHCLGSGRLRSAFLPLRGLICNSRPQILFSTIADANVVAAAACLGQVPRPALVLRETNPPLSRTDFGALRRALAGMAYRHADRVIALSHGVGAEIAKLYGLSSARLTIIGNPVSMTPAGTPAPPRPDAAPKGGYIVAAGRMVEQKDFPTLVQAWHASGTDRALVILGEGPGRAALSRQAADLGVSDRLHLPGFVAGTEAWFAHADLFVLSSAWEGFGHVIVEAMAAGVPVLATDCPHGPRDIIDDGVDGVLCPPRDPVAMGRLMADLLADPQRRGKLASNGRQKAENFRREVIAARYADVLRDVIDRSVN